MTETFEIIKIKKGEHKVVTDLVIREIPLTIIVDDAEIITLLCCPNDLENLVAGFLFTSGLIMSCEDIKGIVISRDRWIANVNLANSIPDKDLIFKRLYTSGCGRGAMFYTVSDITNRGKVNSTLKIEAANINNLMTLFQKRSKIYLKTGGVHSAALSDGRSILAFEEDIGRHNAIDKVIGRLLADKEYFKDKIVITSGRVSSEVLLKVQKCGLPMIISKGAPTDQAVKLAKDMEITLIGFARGGGMNVYSNEERII